MLDEIEQIARKYITARHFNLNYSNGKLGNPFWNYSVDPILDNDGIAWDFIIGLIEGCHYNSLLVYANGYIESAIELYIKNNRYKFSKGVHDKFLWYALLKLHDKIYYVRAVYRIIDNIIEGDDYDNNEYKLRYPRFLLKMMANIME